MDQIVLEHVTKSFTTKTLGTIVRQVILTLCEKRRVFLLFSTFWLRKDHYATHDCSFEDLTEGSIYLEASLSPTRNRISHLPPEGVSWGWCSKLLLCVAPFECL